MLNLRTRFRPVFPSMPRTLMAALFAATLLLAFSCDKDAVDKKDKNDMNSTQEFLSNMKIDDPHSYAKPNDVLASHLELDVDVEFSTRLISGTASWTLDRKTEAGMVIFDTRGLDIQGVMGGPEGTDTLEWKLGDADPFMGAPLEINLPSGTEKVHIRYATQPGAAALQWLDPVQTAGKKQPFLFTQSQAILARTWIPCQDGPGMRFTYHAKVQVPPALLAVMSATNPQEKNETGAYEFDMKQPIPAYLMALSVGDLRFKSIGARTGVYAEPSVLDKAVYEFGDMERMLTAAEGLYGPYRWERYDVIVLPPSFPFGGMENPRLTFATPTILAGDRSLTALIAHELAHSWSGNLVTNANWNDFWLNEGFTVYFERRIMEKLYGESYANMLALLGYQDLEGTIEELGADNPDTKLKLNLDGRDPDEGMTDVAYEKGNFLLTHMEKTVGRDRWDAFLKQYFEGHAFGVMTTEGFVDYVNKELIKGDGALAAKLDIDAWIYSPGLPDAMQVPVSDRFEKVDAAIEAWTGGADPASLETKEWTTHEWLHFIRHLPEEMPFEQMAGLDKAFGFTKSGNSEILAAWFDHVIRNEYKTGYKALENFLMSVGRRKFLKPLYKRLSETPGGMAMGRKIYAKARANYHSVSTGTIDEILQYKGD